MDPPFSIPVGVTSADDIDPAEKERNLFRCRFGRVGTVYGVRLDRFSEITADRAFVGIGGVGRPHYFAVLGNRILAFQHLHNDRTGGHKVAEVVKKRAFLVNGVKLLGLFGRQAHSPLGNNAQTGLLKAGDNRAGEVPPRCVGLDY